MFELFLALGVAAALMAGIFLAFSSFVMPALDNIDSDNAIAAMQRINIDVFCWSFGILFFGIPIASLAIAVYSLTQWPSPWATHALLGSAIYLTGSLIVTIAGNVPLNNKLARIRPSAETAATAQTEWRAFTVPWTRWNHLRTLASAAAALAFLLAATVAR